MTTDVTQINQEAAPVEQPAAASINLADLQNVVRVIDHACEQGAFKGWAVIEQVFALRTKINTFVEASLPPEPVKAEAPKKATKPSVKTTAKAPAKAEAKPTAPVAKKPAAKKVPAKRAP